MSVRSGVEKSFQTAVIKEYGYQNTTKDHLRGSSNVKVTAQFAKLISQAAIKPQYIDFTIVDTITVRARQVTHFQIISNKCGLESKP